jgi:AraC-like DNA-binding protein
MIREKRPMKLAAIGSAVGYESESSFGKVFRRVMGISPGQYRKREQAPGLDTGAARDAGALFRTRSVARKPVAEPRKQRHA